jgi:hypothetical protein
MVTGHRLTGKGWGIKGDEYERLRYSKAKIGEHDVKGILMSVEVAWCNIDDPETNAPHQVPGHAFPDSDPDMQRFSQTRTVRQQTGDNYGQPTYQDRQIITTEIVMCGYHWRKQNPFQPTENTNEKPKAIALDEQNEDYLKGYHDGKMEG